MTTAPASSLSSSSRRKSTSWLTKRKRSLTAAYATLQWRKTLHTTSSSIPHHLISRKTERRATTVAFALILVTTLLTTDDYLHNLYRKLCAVPRPYVTVGQALTLPHHPNVADVKDASHISLCHEFVRRSALSPIEAQNEPMFYLQEDMNVCLDWSNPHTVLMELFGSSLVAKIGSELGLVYNHDCRRALPDHTTGYNNDNNNNRNVDSTTSSNKLMGMWDSTSAQQLLASSLISNTDLQKLDPDSVLNLCRGCIAENEARASTATGTSYALNPHSTHQCLLFPGSGSTENSRVALGSVLPSITKRLRHVAADWIDKTDPLPYEEEEGVIVFLDDTSDLMHYSIYNKNIPDTAKKLQILATASCAHASVTQDNNCIEHGRRVKRFMMLNRPELYVRYDVVASTAASYARMIKVKTLICPPGTISCLLPALCKDPGTDAIIAEAASSHSTFSWFGHVMDAKEQMQGQEEEQEGEGGSSGLDVLTLEEEELEMSLEEIGERERAVVNPIEDGEGEGDGGDNKLDGGEMVDGGDNGGVTDGGGGDGPEFVQDGGGPLMVDGVEGVQETAPQGTAVNPGLRSEGGGGGMTNTPAVEGEGQVHPAMVQMEGEYPIVGYTGSYNTEGVQTEGADTLTLQLPDPEVDYNKAPVTTEGSLVISGGDMSNGQTFSMNTEGNFRGRENPIVENSVPSSSGEWTVSTNENNNDNNNNVEGNVTPEGRKGVPVPIDEPYGGPMDQDDLWNRDRRRREEQKNRQQQGQQKRRKEMEMNKNNHGNHQHR